MLLGLLLLSNEFGVKAIREIGKESLVVALLNDFALLHHNDVVSIPDGRESMGDNNSGNRAKIFPNLIYGGLNLLFILLV